MHSIKSCFNLGVFYVVILTLYYFKGSLHIENIWVVRFLYSAIGIISIYCTLKVLKKESHNKFFLSLNLFLVYILIHGIIYYFSNVSHYNEWTGTYINKAQFTVDVLYGFMPIYAFYYFTKKKYINEETILFYTILYLMFSIIKYVDTSITFFSEHIYRDSMTNNTSYEFVFLFPLLVFYRKKPVIQFLLLFCMLFFMVSGVKRGAIFIGAICLIYFFYNSYKITLKSKPIYIFIAVIAVVFCLSFFKDLILNNIYFLERIEDTINGDSSGRDFLYDSLWQYYVNADFGYQLFGTGAYSTMQIAGNLAHQDWLELLIDTGCIGCVLYFSLFYSFRKTIISVKDDILRSSLYLAILIIFLKSLFSMSYSNFAIPLALSVGYCLAMNCEESKIK